MRPSSPLPQLPYVLITRVNLGQSVPPSGLSLPGVPIKRNTNLTQKALTFMYLWERQKKGRKGGDFVPQNPDKLPKMLTSFFPGFHLIWQLFLIIFLCFFQNLPNIPTLLGPQLPGCGLDAGTDFGCTRVLGPADALSPGERYDWRKVRAGPPIVQGPSQRPPFPGNYRVTLLYLLPGPPLLPLIISVT